MQEDAINRNTTGKNIRERGIKMPICGPECQKTLNRIPVLNANKILQDQSTELENVLHLSSKI